MKAKNGLLWWVLAAVALAAAVIRFAAGVSALDELRYIANWHVTARDLAVQPISAPDWGDPYYQYYRLTFELENHSQRPLELQDYTFIAQPQDGDRWAVRFDSDDAGGSATYPLRPVIPQGCTGLVTLTLRADPEELDSPVVDILLDDYDEGILLGQITLPL